MNMIGGRLDWVAFGEAAKRLLPQLLREPVPYPPIPGAPPPPPAPPPALPVRLILALKAIIGDDIAAATAWMVSPNETLKGIPMEKTKTVEGLEEVVAYLEGQLAAGADSIAPDAPG